MEVRSAQHPERVSRATMGNRRRTCGTRRRTRPGLRARGRRRAFAWVTAGDEEGDCACRVTHAARRSTIASSRASGELASESTPPVELDAPRANLLLRHDDPVDEVKG